MNSSVHAERRIPSCPILVRDRLFFPGRQSTSPPRSKEEAVHEARSTCSAAPVTRQCTVHRSPSGFCSGCLPWCPGTFCPGIALRDMPTSLTTKVHPGLSKTRSGAAFCRTGVQKAGPPDRAFRPDPRRDRYASTIVRELAVRRPPGEDSAQESVADSAPYGKDCFLFGSRSCGYLDVRTHNGTRLSACACRKDTASSGTEQNLSHRT